MLIPSLFLRRLRLKCLVLNILWWWEVISDDKNNSNINFPTVHMFNDLIARMVLIEINRSGARFTWTNKQLRPVRSVLDRVFVSPAWKLSFPDQLSLQRQGLALITILWCWTLEKKLSCALRDFS
jgi:hypothetical protein